MYETHYPLVSQIASQIALRLPPQVPRQDLFAWGVAGLFDASRRYDPAQATFQSFAKHRIRGAILDGLRSTDPVRRTDRKRFHSVSEATHRLSLVLGRAPDEEEIADTLGLSLPEWQSLRAHFCRVGFIHDETKLGMDTDRLTSSTADGYEAVLQSERRDNLHRAIATLPPRERVLIQLYYGRGLTLKEISVRFSVNESRACQLHRKALSRLRTELQGIPL